MANLDITLLLGTAVACAERSSVSLTGKSVANYSAKHKLAPAGKLEQYSMPRSSQMQSQPDQLDWLVVEQKYVSGYILVRILNPIVNCSQKEYNKKVCENRG